MRRTALWPLLALLAPTPQAQQAPRAGLPGRIEAEKAVAALVEPARAQKRVRELVALGPRMGGTDSGHKAAAYAAEAFRAAGLEVRVVEDPQAWCHQESGWKVVAHPEGGEPVPLASAWPYGYSPSSTGRARLLADAEERTDEERVGSALLSARLPRAKAGWEPALILVDGSVTLDGSYPVVRHLRAGDDNKTPCFGLSRPEGERLRAWLAEGKGVEVEFELQAQIRRAAPRTVIARLPARTPAGEPWSQDYLLFCAHGDSDAGGPGADDNASGSAVLLEIAAAWAAGIRAGSFPAPAREVRFAIWGAEIHSSRAYLEARVPGEGRLLGLINYDQAGFGSGADQLHIEPDDLPANEPLVRLLLEVLRDHAPAGTPATPGDFPGRWSTNKSLGGTDSYVFSGSKRLQASPTPALTLFTSAWGKPEEHARTPGMPGEAWTDRDKVAVDYDVYYHSAGDTPENTTDKEPWNMAWCARIGLIGAARWLETL